MDPLAASRAYGLLAELLSRGVTPATREAALASPILAEAILGHEADDTLAVDHWHAFGFSVHPYEGAFLDPDGAVGASAAERLAESYRRIGFRFDPTGDDPEHLATELRALAFLCGAESDAARDGLDDVAARVRTLTASFLDAHVTRWLPPFAAAVRRTGLPFPTALVTQLEALVEMHRAVELPHAPFALPPVPDVLGESGTGLTDIARLLATPALAGLYLSRDDIARVARASGVPRGFGERAVILENALRSAAHLDALPRVLDELLALLEAERDAAREPWRGRLDVTVATVRRLLDAASPQPEVHAHG